MYSVLCALTWRTIPAAARSKLCTSVSAWFGVFASNAMSQQHPTKHQLYGHLPPITKTIQVRRASHAGHCWRSRDELISDVLLWTPTYRRAKVGRPARTYIQQLCDDTGCSPEDLPEAMNDREKWRERVRDIRASGTTWWWWYIYFSWYCRTKMARFQINRVQGRETRHCSKEAQRLVRRKQYGAGRVY